MEAKPPWIAFQATVLYRYGLVTLNNLYKTHKIDSSNLVEATCFKTDSGTKPIGNQYRTEISISNGRSVLLKSLLHFWFNAQGKPIKHLQKTSCKNELLITEKTNKHTHSWEITFSPFLSSFNCTKSMNDILPIPILYMKKNIYVYHYLSSC